MSVPWNATQQKKKKQASNLSTSLGLKERETNSNQTLNHTLYDFTDVAFLKQQNYRRGGDSTGFRASGWWWEGLL